MGGFLIKVKIKKGDIFQFKLTNGKYAYGRVFDKTTCGFIKKITENPYMYPKDNIEYYFIVWFQTGAIEDGTIPIIGNVPFKSEEECKQPLMGGKNPIYGYAIYENDTLRGATKEECEGLEPPMIFDLDSVINKIMKIVG